MNDRYFLNLLSSRLNGFIWKSKDLSVSRCPVCGDSQHSISKKRLYFFPSRRTVGFQCYCHNCGLNIPLQVFIKLYFPDLYEKYIIETLSDSNNETTFIDHKKDESGFSLSGYDLSSCIKIKDIPTSHFVRRYVDSRLIPHSKVLYINNINKILPSTQHIKTPIPCLVIPFYTKNNVVNVIQIRFFDSKVKPKYLTFKLHETDVKCYNLDFIDNTKEVYVCEGPIDSMMIHNSVALAGSELKTIESKINKPVFIFDNEPRSKIICKKMQDVISSNHKILIYPSNVQEKDLNEMKINERNIESIIVNNVVSGLDALLRFQMWKRC